MRNDEVHEVAEVFEVDPNEGLVEIRFSAIDKELEEAQRAEHVVGELLFGEAIDPPPRKPPTAETSQEKSLFVG